MLDYERLQKLAKEKGISLSFLSRQLGKSRVYIVNCRDGSADLPAEQVAKISEMLGTTPEYLSGQTDVQGTGPDVLDDVLDLLRYRPECKLLFSTLRKASAEDVLKAAKIIDALRDE